MSRSVLPRDGAQQAEQQNHHGPGDAQMSLTKEEEENLFSPFSDNEIEEMGSSEVLPDAQVFQFSPSYPDLGQRTPEFQDPRPPPGTGTPTPPAWTPPWDEIRGAEEQPGPCQHREYREVQFCLICPRYCISRNGGIGFRFTPCHSKFLNILQCSNCNYTQIKKNGDIFLID